VLSHAQLEDIYGDELMQVLRPAPAALTPEDVAAVSPFSGRIDESTAGLLAKQAT
jgi:hypothetical protein